MGSSAKLICVQSENDRLKQELSLMKAKTDNSDKEQCDKLNNLEQTLIEKEKVIEALEEKINQTSNSLNEAESKTNIQIEELTARLANECKENEEILRTRDETISNLTSS